MKKPILTLTIIGASLMASAQKLPSKVTIILTDKQVLRIDSAINAGASWTDSKRLTEWYVPSFNPIYEQIRKQVIDTTKVKKP